MSLFMVSGECRAVESPEIRFTPSGQAVCNLRVACNERFLSDDNTWQDGESCFLAVTVWGDAAESVGEYVEKGMLLWISGKLFGRSWETKDGDKRVSYEVKNATISRVCKFIEKEPEEKPVAKKATTSRRRSAK